MAVVPMVMLVMVIFVVVVVFAMLVRPIVIVIFAVMMLLVIIIIKEARFLQKYTLQIKATDVENTVHIDPRLARLENGC